MYTCDHELRLYGHRGASALVPENTLEAFQQALADGANALELDVHRTVDGQLVVAHDPDGARMALSGNRICDCTLEEVKAWDVGRGFGAAAAQLHAMPTLAEVIDAFPGVPLSVDLKPNDPRIVTDVLHLTRDTATERLVTVGSFHPNLVYRLRRLGYSGPTSLTHGEVAAVRLLPLHLSRRLVGGQAAMIPRKGWGFTLDGPQFIARCRLLGLRVDYWVVNDPRAAHALLASGATGIVTDDPQRIAPVVAEFDRAGA
jgi:glycerophosphoryl diester phosphodiesterase